MTQKQLILAYVKYMGSITPAKMAGEIYLGQMFGSETSKRCRELRREGALSSHRDGKFERFVLAGSHADKQMDLIKQQQERLKKEEEAKNNEPLKLNL